VIRRALPVLAAAALAACATGGKLRQNAAVARADIEKAKRSGGDRCAPKELALAEANVDFATAEMSQGNATRAREHLEIAETNVKKALELSKSCGPTQVTIREKPKEVPLPPPPPETKRIVKTDVDGDGVPDIDDRCPEVAGKAQFLGCPDTDDDGIPDAEDACPMQAGRPEAQGCPVAKDSDGDGIPDDIDRCPLDPEDRDGFQDEDGCPDADDDDDGIVDKMDACPNNPGPIENRGCPIVDVDGDGDGIVDRLDRCPAEAGPGPDGCPKKYTLVEVKKDKIEIKQQVHFASAKYRILPDSYALLDQVVQVLRDYPKMRISIEGHTDSVGTEAGNMRLSQRRADAVRAYLEAKGIAPDRLESVGYGPTKPIASNRTSMGRGLNRRTEFRIIAQE
jgi:outer membrane protein OmpA-like peptidoglycan-associated protein